MLPLTYILLVLLHAYYDSTEIKKGIIIDHFRESIYYLFAFMLLGVAFKLTLGGEVLPLILFPLLARAAFFDPLLNLFIGKGWLFEGVSKPKSKESWWDRLERQIGLPVWVYRIIYILAFVSYTLIYYL